MENEPVPAFKENSHVSKSSHRRSKHRPTRQLEFHQAMEDFKTMFPMMDNDVIEAVLRANDGAVDATIDQLLTMSIDAGDESDNVLNLSQSVTMTNECPEYREQRSEDSPPTYTEAVQPSIWTTPISSASPPIVPSRLKHSTKDADAAKLMTSSHPGSLHRSKNINFFDEQDSVNNSDEGLAEIFPSVSSPFDTRKAKKSSGLSKTSYKNWNPPLLGNLPDDFLRLTPPTPKRSPLTHTHSLPAPVSPIGSPFGSPHGTLQSENPVMETKQRDHKSNAVRHRTSKSSANSTERKKVSRSLSERNVDKSWMLPAPQLSDSHTSSRRSTTLGSKSLMISSLEFSQDMLDQKMKENERRRRKAVMEVDPSMSQYLEDERLAIMLQNGEFLNELKDNEDFMKTLEKDQVKPSKEPELSKLNPVEHEGYGDDKMSDLGPFPFSQSTPPKEKDEHAELRQQLRHMGGASRKQFSALARKFFSRKKKKTTLKQIQKEKLAPSMVNLLDSDEEDFDSQQDLNNPYNQNTDIEPLPSNLVSVPSYKTVQRPPYHPETITTYHDNTTTDIL